MRKIVIGTKATFGLASKSEDTEHERRQVALKEAATALSTYKSAVTKARASMKSLVESMDLVSEAFDKLANVDSSNSELRKLSLGYAAVATHTNSTHYSELDKQLETLLSTGVHDVKRLHDESVKLDSERTKVMNEYNSYREEVSTKEAEYAKKGKQLAESKSYAGVVAKRDSLEEKFTDVDQRFKLSADTFIEEFKLSAKSCMESFMECMNNFFHRVYMSMETSIEDCKPTITTECSLYGY